ncbi:MAG: DUF4139 domain-containing protein [Deltaproteobacteria bacterium]|jgi:hypothetical protein|nr:DUF4139 domain-containing protein [Deltaproteobacteria bacterium]
MRYSACLGGVFLLLLSYAAQAAPFAAEGAKDLLLETGVPAQPEEVFFDPDEARLEVAEKLKPRNLAEVGASGGQGYVLTLPFRADRKTFSATVNGSPAAGTYWLEDKEPAPVPYDADGIELPLPGKPSVMDLEREPSPERRAILEKLLPLRAAVAEKSGNIAAVQFRLELLNRQLAARDEEEKKLAAEDVADLDELAGKILPGLYVSYEQNRRELYNLCQNYALVQEELDKFDASRKFSRLVIPAGDSAGEAEIRYFYSVRAAYSMEYRLLAYPEKKELLIEQGAVLRQESGFVWEHARIVISGAGRDRRLQPDIPREWKITEAAPVQETRAAKAYSAARSRDELVQNSAAADMDGMVLAEAPRPALPVAEQRSTFRVWKLGRQSILPDVPVRVRVSADTLPAAYYYTLRPADYFRAFLTAELNLQAPLELAPGAARFFVDDVAMGERAFSFNGTRGSVFFGTDPQVTGIMRSLKRSSGETGFISKEKTVDWNWEIIVSNSRPYPVEARIEDPAPETTDEKFTLEVSSSPKPEFTTTALNQGSVKIYRWTATLKPDEKFVIKHRVLLSSPADKIIDPGRGEK